MDPRLARILLCAPLALAVSSCQSDSGSDCTPGAEACECNAGMCLTGLECRSGLCVQADPDDTGDASSMTAESDADASAWLKALPGTLPMSGEKRLTGVGDEALIWARMTTSGKTTIRFRKARYIAAVTAPSETMATRLANMVAAQIHE